MDFFVFGEICHVFLMKREDVEHSLRLRMIDTDAIRYNQTVINLRFNDYVFLGDSN